MESRFEHWTLRLFDHRCSIAVADGKRKCVR
jgi:hypothetical protein